MSKALESALRAAIAGISVCPPRQDGTKRPLGEWKRFTTQPATLDEIDAWYEQGLTGVGWICGKVSGGLEVIDFDDRGALAEYELLCAESGVGDLLGRVKEGYFEHSPNGAHLAYRCGEIAGNTKLAKRGAKTLIETRGEGGFIIVAPSYGSVNQSGPYELVSGSVETIVTITPDERRLLRDVARMLDSSIQPTEPRQSSSGHASGDRPGDDFNERASWREILEPHGWTLVGGRLKIASWRRPGKKRGISATTNYNDSGLLYVFSTNTPFESERGYSKFSAYALLNHGGDYTSAASELSLLGYGRETVDIQDDVDLSGLDTDGLSTERQSMAELLQIPGVVGEIAAWINAASIKPQPVLALGAALAAAGNILGRRVKTATGLRTNLYVLGVGHTGCGKEKARQCIHKIFAELGASDMIGESFASDSAVETAVADNPACLYLVDEIGFFFGQVKDRNAPSYVKSIVPVLLRLYGASEGYFQRRTYADSERNQGGLVKEPHLSLYGTTVPGSLYGNLTRESLSNGLISRFLVFESDDPDPPVRIPSKYARAVPDKIKQWARRWLAEQGDGGDITPEPIQVEATSAAWQIFSDFEEEMRAYKAREREAGRDQGPYSRCWAMAQKLALIRACGIHDRPEITEEDAQWGSDLVWRLTTDFLDRVGDSLTESKAEENIVRLERVIRDAGCKGLRKGRILAASRWMGRRERDDALSTLVDMGKIVVSKKTDTGGRPALIYVHRSKV